MSKDDKIYNIYKVLYAMYGKQGWWPLLNEESKLSTYHVGDYSFPKNELEKFEICLGAFLTQNTTFTSVVTSLQNLKSLHALSPAGIKNLDIEIFKLAIKPSGYYNQKAKYILKFITFFEELQGETPTREALLKVLGVGEETADSILLYAYNKEEFIIDAYTKRMFFTLGLIDEKEKYINVKKMIQNALNPHVKETKECIRIYQEYHALIVKHAKVFYSRKPYGVGCLLLSS